MPDVVAISTALSAIKTAADIARLLGESDRSLEKAELKLRLAEIISALADAKIQVVEFRELLGERDAKVTELETAFSSKDEMVRAGDAMYPRSESGEAKGQSYCLRCWSEDHKRRPLVFGALGARRYECPHCKTQYHVNRAAPR